MIKNYIMNEAEEYLRLRLVSFDSFSDQIAEMALPQFAPPFSSYDNHTGNIISYLTQFYTDYLNLLNSIDCLDDVNKVFSLQVEMFRKDNNITDSSPEFNLAEETENLCDAILNSITAYFHGSPSKAYEILSKEFTNNNNFHLLNIIPQLHMINKGVAMYRVRKNSHSDWKKLFHVPFESRTKCASYRYSIAGVPALYCGASIKTALLETNIHTNEDCSLAEFRFKAGQDYPFIDLTLPNKKRLSFWERYGLLLFYPLIVACGLKVKNPDAPFKPEYIIPQIFFQIVRNNFNIFFGIIFNSTRYEKRDFSDYSQSNFVVFVRDCEQEFGYSPELSKMLEVKGPIQFKYIDEDTLLEQKRNISSLSYQDCDKSIHSGNV